MKKLKQIINNMSVSQKIELLLAVVLTIALAIIVPTIAWFNYQREIIKLQKVQSPNALFLSAAHREDSKCFEIDGINADEVIVDGFGIPVLSGGDKQKITHKDYVFCVTGEAVSEFTIQLAYTTNNPFTYKVYAANELTAKPTPVSGTAVDYVEYKVKGVAVTGMPEVTDEQYHTDVESPTPLYYRINTAVSESSTTVIGGQYIGRYLNGTAGDGTGPENANGTGDYHDKTYATYTNVHIDAEPVYWQATRISAFPGETNSNKQAFSRHFILRIEWPDGELDNTAKETDIVYITVKATK